MNPKTVSILELIRVIAELNKRGDDATKLETILYERLQMVEIIAGMLTNDNKD